MGDVVTQSSSVLLLRRGLKPFIVMVTIDTINAKKQKKGRVAKKRTSSDGWAKGGRIKTII